MSLQNPNVKLGVPLDGGQVAQLKSLMAATGGDIQKDFDLMMMQGCDAAQIAQCVPLTSAQSITEFVKANPQYGYKFSSRGVLVRVGQGMDNLPAKNIIDYAFGIAHNDLEEAFGLDSQLLVALVGVFGYVFDAAGVLQQKTA